MASLVTELGGTNVQASAPEVRDIIEKGVADAVTFPWGSIVLFGIDKVTKYHMEVPLYTTSFVWVMNKSTYARCRRRSRKSSTTTAPPNGRKRSPIRGRTSSMTGIAKIRAEPGHEVYTISDEQLAEWKAAAGPVVQNWTDAVKQTGVDPDAIVKELKA